MKNTITKTSLILLFLFWSAAGLMKAQNVKIGSGTIVSLNTSTLTLSGNLNNSGTFNADTGTVEFNGTSGNQTITGVETFENLTINKSSGNVALSNNIDVDDYLTCTSGNLDLNGYSCTLGNSAMLNELPGSEAIGGTISITVTLNNLDSLANPGGIGAAITSNSNHLSGTIITRGSAVQSANSNNSIKRYYDITPTNDSGLNATLVFHYNTADLNGLTEANLKLFKSTDGGTTWTIEGGTVNTTAHTVTLNRIDSFSRWTLGPNTLPLPVEMVSFAANVQGPEVNLHWQTSTEVNNYGFEIQRSVVSGQQSAISNHPNSTQTESLTNWLKIGFVKGSGNSNSPKQYSFVDQNPTGGNNFDYRLKQVDNNGAYKYSDVIDVKVVPAKYELFQNYPNPFNPATTIKYAVAKAEHVTLKVYDEIGRELLTLVNENKAAGQYNATFDGSKLTSGVYFYRMEAGSFSAVKKLLLLK